MTKSKLSKIMKEAHRRTKVVSKQYKVNYKTQLSLELKAIYKEIKAFKIAKAFIINENIELNDYLYGTKRNDLINKIYRESGIKFDDYGCIKGIHFAKRLATRYQKQTLLWL